MAEYERQFAATPVAESAFVPAPQPVFAGAAGLAVTPVAQPALVAAAPALAPVERPEFVESAPIGAVPAVTEQPAADHEAPAETEPQSEAATQTEAAPQAQTSAAPETGLQHLLTQVRDAAQSPHTEGLGEELGGAALAADGLIGFGRNRTGIFGALKGIGTGFVIVVLGLAIMAFMGANNTAKAGEVTGTGIVTSLGSTSGNSCTPVARFAVAGKSYTADSSIGILPCPVGLGQSVNVIYSSADPASDARVEMGTSVTQFLWLVPVLGGVVFLSSLFTFIVRAGSIAGGIALVRDGRKRRKEPAEAS